MDFVKITYGLPEKILEFFPLGGFIADDDTYLMNRNSARLELNLRDDQTVFLQSGKFDAKKRLVESLKAFAEIKSPSFVFLIVGRVHASVEAEVNKLAEQDPRVRHLGWKSADELYQLLCGADVYIQPGSQSATMQMSLCARCPVIIADVPSHEPFVKGNGWKVSDMQAQVLAFKQIENDPDVLREMSTRSFEIACELLDYRRMAKRILI